MPINAMNLVIVPTTIESSVNQYDAPQTASAETVSWTSN
jgi:hypothetical protein